MEEPMCYSRQNTRDMSSAPAVPKINCPEVLVFCLDLSTEFEKLQLRSRSGDIHSGLTIAKRCIRMFILNKCAISENTQFGLMILHQKAQWVKLPHESGSIEILQYLDDLDNIEPCHGQADMSTVFKLFLKELPPPLLRQRPMRPELCARLVLIYGRSRCVPHLPDPQAFNLLQSSPFFFVDALYMHEPPADNNCVQHTFDALCDLDEKGVSYVLSAASNMTRAYNHSAQLLTHPLQRPLQGHASYRLQLPPPLQQVASVVEKVEPKVEP